MVIYFSFNIIQIKVNIRVRKSTIYSNRLITYNLIRSKSKHKIYWLFNKPRCSWYVLLDNALHYVYHVDSEYLMAILGQ